MTPLRRTSSRQRGQALTEFLVAALVLVPLFVLMPMIGKYQDISFSTLMASRYVAFDATVRNDSVNSWKPEAQVAQEVRRRFFGNSKTPIKTDDTAGDFTADRNGMWADPTGKPLIEQFDRDVTVTFGKSFGTKHTDGFDPVHGHDYTPFQGHSHFNLPARGAYSANVTVSLANLPGGISIYEPFDSLNLKMTRFTAVLLDPWAARNPDDVQSRLKNPLINPSEPVLKPLQPVVNLAVEALDGYFIYAPDRLSSIRGPKLGDLTFWTDVVQSDRLR